MFCLLTRGDCTGGEFGLCPLEALIQMDGGRRAEEKERDSMRKLHDCMHANAWIAASPSGLLLRGYKPMFFKSTPRGMSGAEGKCIGALNHL